MFQNRERQLPPQPRGHYREYTVRTPGLGHRGPRRIVTGGDPPQDYWYTDDHYASFRRFEVARWMLVGVAQTLVSGALSLLLKPINPPAARHHLIAACGGLGKVFWMTRFRGSLYGSGLVS